MSWRRLMRWAPALLLAACWGPEHSIGFLEPVEVQVPAGTLLQDVASAHRVSVQELQGWNGLDAEVVEEDRTLLVWKVAAEPSLAQGLSAEPADEAPAVAAAPGPRAPRAASRRPAPKVVVEAPMLVVDSDEGGTARVTLEAPPDLRGLQPAGLLGGLSGIDDGDLTDGLADSVGGLGGKGAAPGQAGLGARSGTLGKGGGKAEGLTDMGRTPQTRVAPEIPDTPVRPPRLRMPAAKRCLAAPRAEQLRGDDAMLSNQGLSSAQIKTSMAGFIRHTTACIPKGTKGTYELQVEVTVGCDGRVSNVWIPYGGALPSRVTECIAQTLRFASFPAHAVPDGVSFVYPLQYRF